MFFISRRTWTARAGFSTQLEYVCALCGSRANAAIESMGVGTSTAVYGIGGGAEQAQQGAQASAHANAIAALQHAPCPRCGGYQPIVTQRYAAFGETVAKKKKRSLPLAAIAGALVLLAGVVPAALDLRHSSALLVAVVTGAVAVFGLFYAVSAVPPARPTLPMGAVHFWWGRPDGSVGWMPPPQVPLPALPPPSSLHVLGGAAAAVFGLASLIGLIAWAATFESVYVVDARKAAIVVDGVDVTKDATTTGFEDANVRKITVRSGEKHVVEIAGVKYPLAAESKSGWVVAPDAKKHDVCFAEMETVYGGSKSIEPGWKLLEPKDGVLTLSRSYDEHFKKSPKTQEVKAGQTVRRWALRTVRCSALLDHGDAPEDDDHL